MSKEQTEKSRYQSRYSPDQFVSAAQYIIELVCERKAQLEERDLPVQFWKQPEWEKYFKMQLRKCHALLKKYDEKIRYNYPTGKKGVFGDTGANIYIEELLRAADKLVKGDLSGKDVLEKPASQYNWRKKKYAPTNNAR